MKTCPPGKGLILDENEKCVCPPGYAFDENGNCIPCPSDRGFIVDSNGRCVCDSSRGLVLDPTTNRCVCPPGKELDKDGFCVDSKFWPDSKDFLTWSNLTSFFLLYVHKNQIVSLYYLISSLKQIPKLNSKQIVYLSLSFFPYCPLNTRAK